MGLTGTNVATWFVAFGPRLVDRCTGAVGGRPSYPCPSVGGSGQLTQSKVVAARLAVVATGHSSPSPRAPSSYRWCSSATAACPRWPPAGATAPTTSRAYGFNWSAVWGRETAPQNLSKLLFCF